MMVLPLQRGGPTSSAATGDDSGMMMSQVYAEFLSQSRLEVSLSDLVQVVLTKNAFSGIQTHNFAGAVKKLPQVFPSRDHHDQQPNIIKIVIVSKRQLADRPWRVLSSVATIISTGNCGRNINDKI